MQSSNLLILAVALGIIVVQMFVDRWAVAIAGFFARHVASRRSLTSVRSDT